jgi:peptide/nickel transport system permease protein
MGSDPNVQAKTGQLCHFHRVAYLLRRGIAALGLIWLVLTLTFVLLQAAPGDAADLLVPPDAPPDVAQQLRQDLGLDRSVTHQYGRWLGNLLRGDLGESFRRREPVRAMLADALPISIWLGSLSLFLTFVVGVVVGSWQAARRDQWIDRLLTGLTTTVYAAPSYWLALSAVALFTYGLSRLGAPAWMRLPAFGVMNPASEAVGIAALADILRHSILPVAVLAAVGAAGIARYARTAVLDLSRSEWVRTARAKGLARRRVMFRHLLANALPPLVVLLMLSLPGVVAGSVFVESIFAWPGMGRVMLEAINARDYPVVMGATVVYATIVVLANAASDVLLNAVDPRRRL